MSEPTATPTLSIAIQPPGDRFRPNASPSEAFWGQIATRMRDILEAMASSESYPTYERPCPTGLLHGQFGIIHYLDHRLLLQVRLRPIKESLTLQDGRCVVGLVVRFDDPIYDIPDISIRIAALPSGIPDITLTIRALAEATGEVAQETCVYSRAFTGEDRIPDLVRFILGRAQAHRSACEANAGRIPRDLGPILDAATAGGPAQARGPSPAESRPPGATWSLGSASVEPDAGRAENEDGEDEEEKPVEPLFPDFDPGAPGERTEITLYDLTLVRRELATAVPDECGRQGPSQVKMLTRLNKLGPEAARRWLEHANAAMVAGIEAIGQRAPHFADVTDFVLVHARASINTGTPMRLPPLLIVDEPGTGKTWYLSRLARALGLPFSTLSLAAITTGDTIQGNHPSWRNSAQGLVSKLLMAEPIANPFIFIDEFDKPTGAHGVQGSLYRPYFNALEPANAERFVDEFLGLPINAAHILWVMAANDIEPIPDPIRSRVTQVKLQPMTVANRIAVAHSIYAEANERLKSWYEPELSPAALAVLEAATPRRMRKAIDGALVRAGADNRRTLTADDVARALAQADAEGATKIYGFVHSA